MRTRRVKLPPPDEWGGVDVARNESADHSSRRAELPSAHLICILGATMYTAAEFRSKQDVEQRDGERPNSATS